MGGWKLVRVRACACVCVCAEMTGKCCKLIEKTEREKR